jgi:hypothetical protein
VTVVSVAQRRVDRRVRATDGTVCVLLRNRPPTPWLECDAEYRPSDAVDVRAPDDLVQLDLVADGQPVLEHPLRELAEVHALPDR